MSRRLGELQGGKGEGERGIERKERKEEKGKISEGREERGKKEDR